MTLQLRASDRIPAEVWPLASFLAEEMEARGWDVWDVAERMSDRHSLGHNVLLIGLILVVHKDGLHIGDDLFAELAQAFDVSEEYFRNLDAIWRKHPDRRVAFKCPEELLP